MPNHLFSTHTPAIRHLLTACAAILALGASASQAAEPLPVTASFSILADLARVVGGERVRVVSLVGTNQDAHVFEARPADVKTIREAKLLIVNGLEFEPWASKLVQSAGYQGETVIASAGVATRSLTPKDSHTKHVHGHANTDPHAWQNPINVVVYVNNIAAALGRADPPGAATYQTNAKAYVQELQALDEWAKAQFAAIAADKRQVITSHDAFGYLAEHYGIRFLAPQGVNTDSEPSAKQVATLIQQIKRESIKAVFVENMSNPRLVAQLAKDAGVAVGASLYSDALSAADKPGASYLQMMRHNVTHLVAGMKLNDGR